MQSLQSQLADMEKQLNSKTADLESCTALIRRFQQATEGESDNLLARFRAGENIKEPSGTRTSSEEPSSATFAKTTPRRQLPPTPESLDGVSDVQLTHQKRRRSGLTRSVSITQLCPFGSHLSIMQWDSNLTAQFDACLQAGISALGPTYRAKGNYLLSIPALDITSDGLLYQVSGLLAITSTDHQGRHFQAWPVLNWTRYNVLVAILTGWERMYGDPAAFQIHLSALHEMTVEHDARRSSSPLRDSSLVTSPSLPVAGRLPDGFGHLRVLGLLPRSLLDLIARLTPTHSHHAQEDMDEWRRTSILLAGLRPTSKPAVDALLSGELGLRVTESVRITTLMFITLVLAVTDNDHWTQPMLSAIEPAYADTYSIVAEDLVGTVYDEVLLWTLCIFYAIAGHLIERQTTCFRRLLGAFMIPPEAKSWEKLRSLMQRYLYHPQLDRRLREIMEIEERKARDELVYEIDDGIPT
ncbi:hypothetical protein KC333_g3398 [Hortaea werneckii]|nr:hypothetical protein KC333_g3398 [Hortaea werneckii]KAI7318029.1 hypothetical protein KC326_g3769 [Hortaea werneckii]